MIITAAIVFLAAGSARSIETGLNQSAITMEFVRIPAGSFYIKPGHHVEFKKPFYMGKYEVTQAQWQAVMGITVSQQHKKANSIWHLKGVGPEYPIYYVSWKEAAEFCKKIGSNFRLPDMTERAYACRAGSKTRFHYGDDPNYSQLDEYAWYYDNSKGSTHPVGQKKPNKWGLHDTYGNVSEWCSDSEVYDDYHIRRGSNWLSKPPKGSSDLIKFEDGRSDLIGFRVVFTGNIESNKKSFEIPLPKATAKSNFAQDTKPKTKPPTRMAITGVVRDDSGIPIDGAYMETRPLVWYVRKYPEGRFEAHRLDINSQTKTDKYYFWARHREQNLVAFVEFNEDVKILEIRLQPGVILTGIIVDPHGQGIQDAKITAMLLPLDWNKLLVPTIIKPDPEGKFEIRALPPGYKFRLVARALGYRMRKIEVSSGNTPGSRIDIGQIVLARGQFSVSGIVVDRKGKPVADAAVHCTGEKQVDIHTKTDAKGRFKAYGIFEGQVVITASKKNSSGQTLYGRKYSWSGASNVKVILK